jgi:L-serine dehydratase
MCPAVFSFGRAEIQEKEKGNQGMNIFEILGPVMVGPSSSHTAGAVRIGSMTRKILGEAPVQAEILLHGSFGATGSGHGTDRALLAGLLGMEPDDSRIPDSRAEAGKAGLSYRFVTGNLRDAHPNTALLTVRGADGRSVRVQASSLGGGRIMVNQIDGIRVDFTGEKPTLIIQNEDKPGVLAAITYTLSAQDVNIATLQLYRDGKGGSAFIIAETDSDLGEEVLCELREKKGVLKVIRISSEEER